MAAFIDITGRRYGRITVISHATGIFWNAKCDCGKEWRVMKHCLVTGNTKSCGCLKHDLLVTRLRTHGATESTEFSIWKGMITRCHCATNHAYHFYGGKGVSVCDRWRTSFAAFFADMGPRPSLKHSIDRYPDKNGNYEPGNCRWATHTEQMRNMRRNRLLTHEGVTLCLSEWAFRIGLKPATLYSRIQSGWSITSALTTPLSAKGVLIQ
jgi:hypothetical protein